MQYVQSEKIMKNASREHAYSVIVGMGATGYSCAQFLTQKNEPFVLIDTRTQPPLLEKFRKSFPDVEIQAGNIDAQLLKGAKEIVMSPGLSVNEPFLLEAKNLGISIVGDIELFFRNAKAPIVAITGSNAKSTVTTLVGEMAKAANINAVVGGNLGIPALDLLDDAVELYVLELSSFQLELLDKFSAKVSAFLNLSEDHLDRYGSMQAYQQAKQRVFTGSTVLVFNADDLATVPSQLFSDAIKTSFTLGVPQTGQFGLQKKQGELYLAKGSELLMPVLQMALVGLHNAANALAALAIGEAAGFPLTNMLETLKTFGGLPHRCQFIKEIGGVRYINDSKGTNVGATLAAIDGLASAQQKNIVLIAGGEGKGADFSPLYGACERAVKACVLMGRDASLIAQAINGSTHVVYAVDMQSAVQAAAQVAKPNDVVLLSPACASFDMFLNYEQRGSYFIEAVEALSA